MKHVLVVLASVFVFVPSANAADQGQTTTTVVKHGYVYGFTGPSRVLRGAFTVTVPTEQWTRTSGDGDETLTYSVQESATCSTEVTVRATGYPTRLSARAVARHHLLFPVYRHLVRAKQAGSAWWWLDEGGADATATSPAREFSLQGNYVVPLKQPRRLGMLIVDAYPRGEIGACDADTIADGFTRQGINRMMASAKLRLHIVRGKRR